MDDDLQTPAAMSLAFETIKAARADKDDAKAAAVFEIFDRAVGLPLRYEIAAVPPEVRAMAKERDEARAAKDWARADRIRAELQADGWTVEDSPTGTVIR